MLKNKFQDLVCDLVDPITDPKEERGKISTKKKDTCMPKHNEIGQKC
jgi:hypothetical protein